MAKPAKKVAKKASKKAVGKTVKKSIVKAEAEAGINDKVNEFMNKLEHPLKAEMEAIRTIILKTNSKMAERVKWNAPSFFYKEDMAAFNPRAKEYVHLVFIFPKGLINDSSGLLEGDYKDRRMAYFYNMADVKSKKSALENVVNQWIALIDK